MMQTESVSDTAVCLTYLRGCQTERICLSNTALLINASWLHLKRTSRVIILISFKYLKTKFTEV
jgi:hypothetical protein